MSDTLFDVSSADDEGPAGVTGFSLDANDDADQVTDDEADDDDGALDPDDDGVASRLRIKYEGRSSASAVFFVL